MIPATSRIERTLVPIVQLIARLGQSRRLLTRVLLAAAVVWIIASAIVTALKPTSVMASGAAPGPACWIAAIDICRIPMRFRLPMHVFAGVALLLLAFQLSMRFTRHLPTALLTTVLYFFCARIADSSAAPSSSLFYSLTVLASIVAAAESSNRDWASLAAISGVLAILAVTMQATGAALVVGIPLAWWLGRPKPAGAAKWGRVAVAFSAGATIAAVVAVLATGDPGGQSSISRHLAVNLAQRAAFVGLDRATWMTALMAPVPLLGDLVMLLSAPVQAAKISISSVPGSLVAEGVGAIYPAALANTATGSDMDAAAYIVREHFLAQPLPYLTSIPVVTMRGVLGGGGLIALVGLLHIRRMMQYASVDGSASELATLLVPALAMLVMNVLVTSNEFWLNPLLPFVYAYAIGYIAGGW